jgi:hypothetical protein
MLNDRASGTSRDIRGHLLAARLASTLSSIGRVRGMGIRVYEDGEPVSDPSPNPPDSRIGRGRSPFAIPSVDMGENDKVVIRKLAGFTSEALSDRSRGLLS